MDNPYTRFRGQSLSLNDYLAIDRTVLANERTLLSYIRTSLTMLVIGGTLLQFIDSTWARVVGTPFVLASVTVLSIGVWRYQRMRRYVAAALEHRTGVPEHPLQPAVKAGTTLTTAASPSVSGGAVPPANAPGSGAGGAG